MGNPRSCSCITEFKFFTVQSRLPKTQRNKETYLISYATTGIITPILWGEHSFFQRRLLQWLLALEKGSQDMISIQQPCGIFYPTKVVQGGTDFQAVTREKFEPVVPSGIQWLDDFLLHAKSEDELVDAIAKFLVVCAKYGFKTHARKSQLPLKSLAFSAKYHIQNRNSTTRGI